MVSFNSVQQYIVWSIKTLNVFETRILYSRFGWLSIVFLQLEIETALRFGSPKTKTFPHQKAHAHSIVYMLFITRTSKCNNVPSAVCSMCSNAEKLQHPTES